MKKSTVEFKCTICSKVCSTKFSLERHLLGFEMNRNRNDSTKSYLIMQQLFELHPSKYDKPPPRPEYDLLEKERSKVLAENTLVLTEKAKVFEEKSKMIEEKAKQDSLLKDKDMRIKELELSIMNLIEGMGAVYLCLDQKTNGYKIGKINKNNVHIDRVEAFTNEGPLCYYVCFNTSLVEKELKLFFNKKFQRIDGYEYFQGDPLQMILCFTDIVSRHIQLYS